MLTDWKVAYVRRGKGTVVPLPDGSAAEAPDGEVLEVGVRFYEGDVVRETVDGKDVDVYRRSAVLDAATVSTGATGKLAVYSVAGSADLRDVEALVKRDVAAAARTPVAEQVLTTADADRALRRVP